MVAGSSIVGLLILVFAVFQIVSLNLVVAAICLLVGIGSIVAAWGFPTFLYTSDTPAQRLHPVEIAATVDLSRRSRIIVDMADQVDFVQTDTARGQGLQR